MGDSEFSLRGTALWEVSALLLAAQDALQARFGGVGVRGELGSFVRASSGHCYFSLKDGQGQGGLLRCAMFRRAASLLDFTPAEGQQVEIRGRLGVYEPRGELQLVVESMRRAGAGSLYEQFLKLRSRLESQGLFDAGRKRPIPREPARLGVVTSLGAAALHDVLTALARRAPHVGVVVYPALVQGAEAPEALAQALLLANRRAEVDTLLLVRGGGSLEDLWAFNDERVVRAIVASQLPVICGVGHETDVTLADLAADLRAPTPTAAAELAAPSRAEQLAACRAEARRLAQAVERQLQRQAQRLDRLALSLGRPAALVAAQVQRVDGLERRLGRALAEHQARQQEKLRTLAPRLQRAMQGRLKDQISRLDAREQRLQSLDPHRVLQRGYAWVETEAGRPIVSAASLSTGQQVRAVWSDGRARALIEEVETPAPRR